MATSYMRDMKRKSNFCPVKRDMPNGMASQRDKKLVP